MVPRTCSQKFGDISGIQTLASRYLSGGPKFLFIAWLCPTLCDPMDYSPSGSSLHRISQARIQGWVVIPSPRDLPNPGTEPKSSALKADSLPSEPPGKHWKD